MKSWKTPTPEQVEKAVAMLVHAEHYRYFFDRLENPNWIMPLHEKGYFQRPPPIKRHDDEGTVSFPPWAESRYLARMAKYTPDVVRDIVMKIPMTDNVRVHEDLADAALSMPVDLAANLVPEALKWIESPYKLLIPQKLGMFIGFLASGGKTKEALELAGSLLAVVPDRRAREEMNDEVTHLQTLRPTTKIDIHYYEEIIKKEFPKVVKSAGEEAVSLLCGLLDSAICFSNRQGRDGFPRDYSYIWRSAVEKSPLNRYRDLENILVDGIRDSVEQISRARIEQVPQLVKIIEGYGWHIFHRIAINLLREFPGAAPTLVRECLTDKKWFGELGIWHEYILLMRACFQELPPEDQEKILGWIEQGPDLDLFESRKRDATGEDLTAEEMNRFKKVWTRDHIAAIVGVLPREWQERYANLVADVGEPEHPEFVYYNSGATWVGPTSPKSTHELQSLSNREICEFLRSWKSTGDPMSPSPEGLGRELTPLVAVEPQRFATDALEFRGLDPNYVRAFVHGIASAAKQKKKFDWHPVIELCKWVVTQPREIQGRKDEYVDLDPGWVWTRKAIADMLSAGFQEGESELPFEMRGCVFEVLRPITEDQDPTPEDERRFGGSNMNPTELSINTTRGEAMHSLIQYALWVRRHVGKGVEGESRLARGFGEMPEVRETLDAHLDPSNDPSLAIRSVYGQWFPWLALIDHDWSVESILKIFPTEESLSELRNSAWGAYITHCQPYDNILIILGHEYHRAVGDINTALPDWPNSVRYHEHLAEHVMTFYWRGKLSLHEPQGLLSRFYEIAPDSLRAHAIEFVGRSLLNTEGEIPAAILDRLRALWDSRLTFARDTKSGRSSISELAAFGWWFASAKFDDPWATKQLVSAIGIAKKIDPDHMVVARLVAVSYAMPRQAIECLKLIVEVDKDEWGVYGWRDNAREILSAAIESGDPDARNAAVSLLNLLGARGYRDFRDLVPKKLD